MSRFWRCSNVCLFDKVVAAAAAVAVVAADAISVDFGITMRRFGGATANQAVLGFVRYIFVAVVASLT